MARILVGFLTVVVLCVAAVFVYTYQQITSYEVAQVTDDLHVIYGLGSNVGVLKTDEGSIVVDTMTFAVQGREIREQAERLGGPVRALVNTHYHFDHTHGNPAFPSGMPVHATQRTRAYMDALDADYWAGEAAGTLPNRTFTDEATIELGGKTVRLLHLGRGHTDGDLVVHFVEDRVIHTGDLFFNGRYPNIDLEAGGSVQEWSATIDRMLELDFEKVIPGHGPVTDAEGLRAFQRFIGQLADVGREAEAKGWSLEEAQASTALDADAGYDTMEIPFVMRLDRSFVLKRAWEEATGNFERVEVEE